MGRLVVVFLASAALATLYQIGKHVLFPHITLWQSHDLTIGLIAVLATAASCYVLVNRAKSVPRPVAEAAARKCEEKYCSLVNNIPEVVWTFDDRGRVVFVSPSIELLSGYSREEIYERGVALFLDCVHPDDLGVVRAGLEALFASGQPYDVECRIHNKNGDWMWVHDRALGTYEKDGVRYADGLLSDITARKRADEARAFLASIVESSSDAIVGKTLDGTIVSWNQGAEALYGYRAGEAIGKSIAMLAPPGLSAQVSEILDTIRRGGRVASLETSRVRKDGVRIEVSITVSPIRNAAGEIVGAATIARDIGDRKRAEEEMRAAREAAEEASRAKSEFLANMSHEIRTPMNGVIGMTDLALATELTTEQREYLHLVKVSADALMRVINDILDFSKIEAKKLDLEHITFDLRETVQQTLKPLAPRAGEKGLELLTCFEPGVPAAVFGDPGRLRQVLTNLIANAIKFTERGEVAVTIVREQGKAEKVALRFSVRDTGIGIPPAKQRTIFEAFVQGDASATRKFGGTGLGLAIASQLVSLMGGRMWLESEAGKGSTFHFTLPLEVAPPLSQAARQTCAPQLEGVPVLAVDDNATNRQILGAMLARWGMAPDVSESGPQALQLLREAGRSDNLYPLIIVDAQMPGMDGFALVRNIKEELKLTTATIMMLTSVPQPGDAARCRALGVAAYLTKPISESELHQAVLEALGSHPLPARTARRTQPARPEPRSQAQRRVLVVEDNAVNRLLALRLLEKMGYAAQEAAGAREALETLEAESFDAVLMDVQMPGLDGFEVTAMIRRKERASGGHLPIIAMTAYAMQGDRERCLAAGMDAYVSKPISAKGLSAALAGLIPPAGRSPLIGPAIHPNIAAS